MAGLRAAELFSATNASLFALHTRNAARQSNWRSQVAAPPEKPVLHNWSLHERSPMQEELLQRRQRTSSPLKQESKTLKQSWSRQEATAQNLIYRMMFDEEPRWPRDIVEFKKDSYELPFRTNHRVAATSASGEKHSTSFAIGCSSSKHPPADALPV